MVTPGRSGDVSQRLMNEAVSSDADIYQRDYNGETLSCVITLFWTQTGEKKNFKGFSFKKLFHNPQQDRCSCCHLLTHTLELKVSFLSPLSNRINENSRAVFLIFKLKNTQQNLRRLVTFSSLECRPLWTPFSFNFSIFKAPLRSSNLHS